MPLRFQKKKLAEQNKLLDDKFLIRQNVLASSKMLEEFLVNKTRDEVKIESTFKAIQSLEKAGSKLKTPSQTSNAKTNIRKSGSTTPKRGNENGSRKQALEDQDEIIELSDDSSVVEIESDLSDAETHYRIKCIKNSSTSISNTSLSYTAMETRKFGRRQ